jgi:hypothetical protein
LARHSTFARRDWRVAAPLNSRALDRHTLLVDDLPTHDSSRLQSSLEDLARFLLWFPLCRPWKEAVYVEAHRNFRGGEATDCEAAILVYNTVAFEAEGLFSIR